MLRSHLILENAQGKVVRTFAWDSDELVVYVNLDTGRVELVQSESELKDVTFPFAILAKSNRKNLSKEGVNIGQKGQLKLVENIGPTVQLTTLNPDTDDEIKTISKWTAISHAALLLIVLLGSFFFKDAEQDETPIVTVFQQQREQTRQTVKVAEKKIIRPKMKARVADRTVKPKITTAQTNRKSAKVRTQVNLSQVGALGALGGMTNGKKGSAGFNVNATNASLGTSLKDIGAGGAGGLSRSVHGKGLVSAPVGAGALNGSGGYATRGKGGGRPGYGQMSMVGGSNGYMLPLEDEALIEGGLDKDQIAAVIQRHLGEIIYCYEKGLQVKPNLSGRVGVFFVIGASGGVNTAKVNQSSLSSSSVEGCILNKLRAWRFPKPVGGVNVKVTYPFVLRRVG